MGTDVDRLQWIALDGNQSTGKRVIASCNQWHRWRRFGLQNICSLGVKAKIHIEDVFSKCFSPVVRPPGPCCLCSISLETRLKERDILELTVTERRTKEEKYALSLPMPVRPNLMTFLPRICPLQNSMQWVCQLFLPFNNKTNAMRHLSNIFLSRKSFTENTPKV